MARLSWSIPQAREAQLFVCSFVRRMLSACASPARRVARMFLTVSARPAWSQESTCETASRKQHELEAKVRLSEGQRSTLEVSVLQMTETISALSSQITDLETRTSAEAQRVSSLEIKLSLEVASIDMLIL